MAKRRSSTHYIVVHAADTFADMDIGLQEIDSWHKARGWSGCGYHFIVRRNGFLELGRDLYETGAHVAGYNSSSIGICMVGGKAMDGGAEDNYTVEQIETLGALLYQLTELFPGAEVCGHRDFPGVNKACPCFDAGDFWLEHPLHPQNREV